MLCVSERDCKGTIFIRTNCTGTGNRGRNAKNQTKIASTPGKKDTAIVRCLPLPLRSFFIYCILIEVRAETTSLWCCGCCWCAPSPRMECIRQQQQRTNERTRTTRRLNNRTSWTSPGHSCAQPQRARVRISNKNGNWRKYCIVYLSFSLSLFHSPSFRMSLSSLRSVLLYIIASTKIADPKNGRERRENNNKQTDSHTRHNQK